MADKNKQEDVVAINENSVESGTKKIKQDGPALQKTETKQKNTFIYFLIFVLVALIIIVTYYFLEQQKVQSVQIEQQKQIVSHLQNQLSEYQKSQNNNTQAAAQNTQQMQMIIADVNNAAEKSQQAIDLVNRSQRDWKLAEVDYLLRMAHQRLEIAKDIKGAVAALKGADGRLNELADLKLFKIRKQIAQDIASLNAIKQIDINGVVLSIDQSLVYLNELPFKSVQTVVKAQLGQPEVLTETTDKTFFESIIETIKRIGDIKIHRRSIESVDSDRQQRQVEQLLYAHLLSARLAVLNYEQKHFMYEIEQASRLLETYYEVEDSRIKNLIDNINNYKKLQLTEELPELTIAWGLLQKEIIKPVELTQEPKE